MKYIFNGKQIRKNEAIRKIYNAVPNGGLRYVENMISEAEENGMNSVEFKIGSFRMEIRF